MTDSFFGRTIWRQGHHRLVAISVHDLTVASIYLSLPDFQRAEDVQHTELIELAMATEFVDKGTVTIPGVITVANVASDETNRLIDGQHRLHALRRLVHRHPDAGLLEVIVSAHDVESDDQLFALYRAVNSSRPVDVSLTRWESEVWGDLERWMRSNFVPFIRKTDRPRPPYFNPTTWIHDAKRACRALPTVPGFSSAVLQGVHQWNLHVSTLFASSPATAEYCKDGLWCCFGAYRNGEWILRVLDHVTRKIPFAHMSHERFEATRMSISKALRLNVWTKRNGNESRVGQCFCCQRRVDYDDFQCGHIVSHCMGGKASLDNLEPICSMCNRDMGVMNLLDYREKLQQALHVE